MNRTLLGKALRDARLLLVILPLAIVAFHVLAAGMLIEIMGDLEQLRAWLERPFVKLIIRSAFGGDLVDDLSPTAIIMFALGHPIYYVTSWALLISMATAAVAGEIGRGTADLLLALPVTRRSVYVSATAAWLLAAVLVTVAPLPGLWLGERIFTLPAPFDFRRLAALLPNLLALQICVGALAMLASAVAARRGQAVAAIISVLLVTDLLKTLAQFWEAARPVTVVGLLHYYKPLAIVRAGAPDWGDATVLLLIAGIAWGFGLAWFCRRDVAAA